MVMGDYKSLPAWKRGMTLAHSIYALAEGSGVKKTDEGLRLRKAAVSVPSLIGEAYLELGRDPEEALFTAEARLAEVELLLRDEPFISSLTEGDRVSLLAEIELLREDIGDLRLARMTRN